MPGQLHRDAVVRTALRSFAIGERLMGAALPHADPVLD
jgi:hypothetical protein